MANPFQSQAQPGTQSQFSSLPQPLQNLATTQANFLTGQTGQTSPAYPYSMAAPLSSGQQAGIGIGNALAPSQLSSQGPATNQLNATLSGQYLDPRSNPYTGAILNYMDQQKQQAEQQQKSLYGSIGLGNSQGLANALAQTDVTASGQEGTALLNQYNQERQNQTGALGYGFSQPQQALSNTLAGGQLQQNTLQNQLTQAYNEYVRQAQSLYEPINAAQGVVGQAFQPQPVSYAPSIFSQALTGATGIASALPEAALNSLFGL
jgi:hypothetical protein